jgi:hypothetical protein
LDTFLPGPDLALNPDFTNDTTASRKVLPSSIVADNCVALCYQTLNGRDPSKEEVELCATLSYIPLKNVEEALERYQQANTLIHDNNLRGIGTLATTVENDEILSTSPSVPDHVQKEEAARYVETLPAKCLRRKVTLPPTGSAPEAHKCPDCGKLLSHQTHTKDI